MIFHNWYGAQIWCLRDHEEAVPEGGGGDWGQRQEEQEKEDWWKVCESLRWNLSTFLPVQKFLNFDLLQDANLDKALSGQICVEKNKMWTKRETLNGQKCWEFPPLYTHFKITILLYSFEKGTNYTFVENVIIWSWIFLTNILWKLLICGYEVQNRAAK